MCFVFLGDCISLTSEGSDVCSEDDASDTDRLYNIFAICRKAMDENAEYQCKREPKALDAAATCEGTSEVNKADKEKKDSEDDYYEEQENQGDGNSDPFCPCLRMYSLF